MDRYRGSAGWSGPGFPRTRGDGPWLHTCVPGLIEVSPHTRGWTRGQPRGHVADPGFPAHAGMDPAASGRWRRGRRFPRTRGDGPPRWPAPVLDSRVSPHTRGWTRPAPRRRSRPRGFPAHAGMDPCGCSEARPWSRFPRTRGDGPLWIAGVDSVWRVSPHTRGWTPTTLPPDDRAAGFPAHAGMDPLGVHSSASNLRFPRTRGDGPDGQSEQNCEDGVSPHTRGWTPLRAQEGVGGDGFPAHAGMDPCRRQPSAT